MVVGARVGVVAAGGAGKVGEEIKKTIVVQPMAIFFDSVARVDPKDPASGLEGVGRFNVENYCLSLVGIPVEKFTGAAMLTTRWAFDGLFPFGLLILVSLVTPAEELARADRFFAKMRTPVGATPEDDKSEVERSYAEPSRFNGKKLFPRSHWQFTKWGLSDVLGFAGCWGIVGAILVILYAVLNIGK
jgi:hypothetical protein